MNNKGFSLIGIVVLILLIGGITYGVIGYTGYQEKKKVELKAREAADKSSVFAYIDAIEKQIMINDMSDEYSQIKDGEYSVEELEGLGVKPKGDKPVGGSVTIKEQLVSNYSLEYSNFYAYPGTSINEVVISLKK